MHLVILYKQMATLKKRPPTLKQKIAIQKIANGSSIRKAMREAGYAPNTASQTTKLTNSEGFKQLLEQLNVTDDRLAKVLDEGLGASKAVVMGIKSEESFVDIQPDFAVRHKYLETGLRLRGYAKEEGNQNLNVVFVNNQPRPKND